MNTLKFPKIGEIIKEFFLSGYFLTNGTLRTKVQRLSNEVSSNLDEVENIIDEVFSFIENKEESSLLLCKSENKGSQRNYYYNGYVINIFKKNLKEFIKEYSDKILKKLTILNESQLKKNYEQLFEKIRKQIINSCLKLTGYRYMNYEEVKQDKDYYFKCIKSRYMEEEQNNNFNYLNPKDTNNDGTISAAYQGIYRLGDHKHTDEIIEYIAEKLSNKNQNKVSISLSLIIARFEKEFYYDKLKPIEFDLDKKEYSEYLKLKKIGMEIAKDKNILINLKKVLKAVIYQTKVDVNPLLRMGVALSSELNDKKSYNYFYMYANYFGLINEKRNDAEWRFESAKQHLKSDKQIKFIMATNDIKDFIPDFWTKRKGSRFEYMGIKRSRLEILAMYYLNFDVFGKDGHFRKTEKDVLNEMRMAIDLDGNKNFVNAQGESALIHSLGESGFFSLLEGEENKNLFFNIMKKTSFERSILQSKIFKILNSTLFSYVTFYQYFSYVTFYQYFSYARTLLLLDEVPDIKAIINTKSIRLKTTPLIALLDNFSFRIYENKEKFITTLKKMLEKGADPNLTGKPEENPPLVLLVRCFSKDFILGTTLNKQHVREVNKDNFSRYDNSTLDDDYGSSTKKDYYENIPKLGLNELANYTLKNNKAYLLECCKILLDAGAKLDMSLSTNARMNIFQYIIEKGDMELFQLAMKYPFDINATYLPIGLQELYEKYLVDGKIPIEKFPLYMNTPCAYRLSDSEEQKRNRIKMSEILSKKKMSEI